jgi:hypothetical protein
MQCGSGLNDYEVTTVDDMKMAGSWSVVAGAVCIVNRVLSVSVALPGRNAIPLG